MVIQTSLAVKSFAEVRKRNDTESSLAMVKMKRRNESALNVKEGHCEYECKKDFSKR